MGKIQANKGGKHKMNLKKQSGITLMLLVITIIVILIIAGASINIVLGEKGLLHSSKEIKDMQENYAIRQEERANNLIDGVGTK